MVDCDYSRVAFDAVCKSLLQPAGVAGGGEAKFFTEEQARKLTFEILGRHMDLDSPHHCAWCLAQTNAFQGERRALFQQVAKGFVGCLGGNRQTVPRSHAALEASWPPGLEFIRMCTTCNSSGDYLKVMPVCRVYGGAHSACPRCTVYDVCRNS